MKLDRSGQQALIKLAEIDLEITQLRYEIAKTLDSLELKNLSDELTELAATLLEARTKFENLELAVKRSEEDLKLVTDRLSKDRERLNQTSSPKDAIGIQNEINSLIARKEILENTELELLADLEQAEVNLNSITAKRSDLVEKLEKTQEEIQKRVDELKAKGRKASADREVVVAKISSAVQEKYVRLATKQVAVATIQDRACSACRMTLTVGAIDALNSLAEDEIGACPECQAMIVR